MSISSGNGWVVYRIERDGSALFLGIFPDQDKAEKEAAALQESLSSEWFVTSLPLLDWEVGGDVALRHPRPRLAM